MINVRVITHKSIFATVKETGEKVSWCGYIRKADDDNNYICSVSEIPIENMTIESVIDSYQELISDDPNEVQQFLQDKLDKYDVFEFKVLNVNVESEEDLGPLIDKWINDES